MYALILLLITTAQASDLQSLTQKATLEITQKKDFSEKVSALNTLKTKLAESYKNKKNPHTLTLINYVDTILEMKSPKECDQTATDIQYIDRNPKQDLSKPSAEAQMALDLLQKICN